MALMKENLSGIVSQTENPSGDGANEDIVAKYQARKDQPLATVVFIELSLLGEPKDPINHMSWKPISEEDMGK